MSGKPPLPTCQSSLVKSRICLRASAEPGNGHRPDDRTCTISPEPDPPPLRIFSSPSTEKATLLVASSHHVKHDIDCCFAGHSRGTTSILVAIPPLILLFILGILVTGYTMPLARQPWMQSRHHGAAPSPATDRSAAANASTSLSALWHSMSDAELFARALALSVSPPSLSEPYSKTRCRGEGRWVSRLEKGGGGGRWGKARTKREWVLDAKARGSGSTRVQGCPWRIAFLFLTTRGQIPPQAAWGRYFHGYDDYFRVYVHSPPGHQLGPEAGVLHGRQVPSQRGPVVDAQRRLIGNALLDPANAWFILCESCIPIQGFEHTYSNLMASNRSFLISTTTSDETKKRTEEKKGSIASGRECQWFAVARVYAEMVVTTGSELGLGKNETGGKRRARVNLVAALSALEPGGASSGMFGDAGRLGDSSPGSKIVRDKQPLADGQIQKQRFEEGR